MIKKYTYLFSILCLFACGQAQKEQPVQETTVQSSDASNSKDYFAHKVSPKYAQHFTVSYHENYKVVKSNATFYPNRQKKVDGKDKNDLLVLVQKGTTAPPLTGELKGAQVISIPVDTVAVNIQHSESYLRELGLVERINAIGGLYSYDEKMRAKAVSGVVGQIGYSWHSPPIIEVLLERKPDLFLMTMPSMAYTESLDKCRQLGIPTVAVFDWAEQDYLARAEWLKFYSLFFNAEAKANEVFEEIANQIDKLKKLAATSKKESAIWGYYTSKSRWLVELSSFPAQYLRDANLENVLLENTAANANGIQSLTTEQLLTRAKEAEHWVIGDIHAALLPKENIMSSFRAWNSGQLYHNMERVRPKTNTADWYATAIVRPDTVLADLIKLIHPELLPDYKPVFMGVYQK